MEMTFQDSVKQLVNIRERGIRESDRVLELWDRRVKYKKSGLGNELWNVLEQVFVAALDTGRHVTAEECLLTLHQQFPNSVRIRRLYGMYLEAIGNYDNAKKVFEVLIEEDATNTLAKKRLIAILKARNMIPEAIEELNKYLKVFMSDHDAWNELSHLYLSCGDYKRAAFCVEELILTNPQNFFYNLKYADIKYTEGGHENHELARSYYAQTCKLNHNSRRALYGILLCTFSLAGQSGVKPLMAALVDAKSKKPTEIESNNGLLNKERRENQKLATWAFSRLANLQTTGTSSHVPAMSADLRRKLIDVMAGKNVVEVAKPTAARQVTENAELKKAFLSSFTSPQKPAAKPVPTRPAHARAPHHSQYHRNDASNRTQPSDDEEDESDESSLDSSDEVRNIGSSGR